MVLDLVRPLPPVPLLPGRLFLAPVDDGLVAAHARAKYASFQAEIDSQVAPGQKPGLRRMARHQCSQPISVARLGNTWLSISPGNWRISPGVGCHQAVVPREPKIAVRSSGTGGSGRTRSSTCGSA